MQPVEVTVLGSGSGGNATFIRCGDDALMIDAGFSGAELQRRLDRAAVSSGHIRAILISHEHDDHTQALRIFCKRNNGIPAYSNSLTAERLQLLKKAPENVVVFANGSPFAIGPFRVEAFSVSHDAVDPVGFVIHCQGRKIAVATDLGHFGKLVPLKMKDSDVLIIESNHDPDLLRASRRPAHLLHRIHGRRGHLSNKSAAELMTQVVGPDTKYIVTAHLSDDCNRPELVEASTRACLKAMDREHVEVIVARQDIVCETIVLDG
mgnify:CR=1 FL=1|jgi:phosphoribosyl 1,2-cyclic phosphodiesterase